LVEIPAEYILGLILAAVGYLNARMECMRRTQAKHIKLAKRMHPKESEELGL